MSCTSIRCRTVWLSFVITFVVAACALAQTPRQRNRDVLDDFRRRQDVAAQKVEFEIRVALRAAQQLAQKDPDKAIERLEKVLAELEEDTKLPEKRREALKRMLKDRIRVIEADRDKTSKEV
ncbi:MAG TPA: hypothetical protein VKI65_06760, partial [Gemmataceae bacterium]|nr:hypothetical protein [Gemmataceae bacterium]